MHLAALKGSQPVVQALLLGGADVDARAKVGMGRMLQPVLPRRPMRSVADFTVCAPRLSRGMWRACGLAA
jgi:hypothetical protein